MKIHFSQLNAYTTFHIINKAKTIAGINKLSGQGNIGNERRIK